MRRVAGPLCAATLGPRTIDLCSPGDGICGNGSNQAAHNQYAGGPANQAASFVAGLL